MNVSVILRMIRGGGGGGEEQEGRRRGRRGRRNQRGGNPESHTVPSAPVFDPALIPEAPPGIRADPQTALMPGGCLNRPESSSDSGADLSYF